MYRSPYADRIERLAPECDPRHVHAFMLLDCGTLDGLSLPAFASAVEAAAGNVAADDPAQSERLAQSYGL